MQNLPVMNMLDSKGHLDEPVEDLIFTVTNFAYFFLICYLGVQIAAICIIHDNAEAPLIHKALLVGDDVRMAHCLEHVHLVDGVLPLLAVHLTDVNDLHYVSLTVSYRLDQNSESERALSDDFKLSILLHSCFLNFE